MEKVASHINEMQKIYEDYGSVFDQLVAEQTGHNKEVGVTFQIRWIKCGKLELQGMILVIIDYSFGL